MAGQLYGKLTLMLASLCECGSTHCSAVTTAVLHVYTDMWSLLSACMSVHVALISAVMKGDSFLLPW